MFITTQGCTPLNEYNPFLLPTLPDQRELNYRELERLVRMISNLDDKYLRSQMEGHAITLLQKIFDSKLEETKEADPIQEAFGSNLVVETNNKENINAASEEVNYHDYAQIEYYLHHISGCKVARKDWDNKFNQEYITWSQGPNHLKDGSTGGLVKFYISAQSDYYKKVEHTYKPTQEDKDASDWYIL